MKYKGATIKFWVGDTVRLSVGGPPMVVERCEPGEQIYYKCVWFDYKKIAHHDVFVEETLVVCEPSKVE
jgi:uncharacterized protein YodC (DUF2158 family)